MLGCGKDPPVLRLEEDGVRSGSRSQVKKDTTLA
jgi:hypothetical protein